MLTFSMSRYESIPQKVQRNKAESWGLQFASMEPGGGSPPGPSEPPPQRLRPLEVRLAKVISCGVCTR